MLLYSIIFIKPICSIKGYKVRIIPNFLNFFGGAYSFFNTIWLTKSDYDSNERDFIILHEIGHNQLNHFSIKNIIKRTLRQGTPDPLEEAQADWYASNELNYNSKEYDKVFNNFSSRIQDSLNNVLKTNKITKMIQQYYLNIYNKIAKKRNITRTSLVIDQQLQRILLCKRALDNKEFPQYYEHEKTNNNTNYYKSLLAATIMTAIKNGEATYVKY
jgi:hypothetical protein